LPAPLDRWVSRAEGTPLEPLVFVTRWGWLFYLELKRDLAFIRAAGMAYATVVAMVPMLVLVVALAEPLGIIGDHPDTTLETLVDQFLGDVPMAAEFLVNGLLRIDVKALGIVATAGLLVVAARLYLSIEHAYHDILGMTIKRKFMYRLVNFYVAATAVPVILLLAVRSGLEGVLFDAGGAWTLPVIGRILLFLLLLGALRLLPSVAVRWTPALAGAAVSFVLIEVGRKVFAIYASLFAYDDPLLAVYGSIALFPVFLLWIYLFWVFVLLGVEVANVIQNHTTLSQAEFEADDNLRYPSVELAVQVATWIAWWFEAGKGPASLDALTAVTRLPARHLRAVLEVLEKGGIAVGTDQGWLLARPAEAIPIGEVIEAWRREAVAGHDSADLIHEDFSRLLAIEGSLADGIRRWIDRPRTALPPRASSAQEGR
jgi:membrane protein